MREYHQQRNEFSLKTYHPTYTYGADLNPMTREACSAAASPELVSLSWGAWVEEGLSPPLGPPHPPYSSLAHLRLQLRRIAQVQVSGGWSSRNLEQATRRLRTRSPREEHSSHPAIVAPTPRRSRGTVPALARRFPSSNAESAHPPLSGEG